MKFRALISSVVALLALGSCMQVAIEPDDLSAPEFVRVDYSITELIGGYKVVLEAQLSKNGGLDASIRKIVDSQDAPGIIKIFKDLILKAYGEKSDDGKRFMKSKEISDAFSQTEAYSQLFMELATDADAASKFINGIVPAAENNANHPAIKSNH